MLDEWRTILKTYSLEQVISLLQEDSTRAARLRQSSPFAGIGISEEERASIFASLRDALAQLTSSSLRRALRWTYQAPRVRTAHVRVVFELRHPPSCGQRARP